MFLPAAKFEFLNSLQTLNALLINTGIQNVPFV